MSDTCINNSPYPTLHFDPTNKTTTIEGATKEENLAFTKKYRQTCDLSLEKIIKTHYKNATFSKDICNIRCTSTSTNEVGIYSKMSALSKNTTLTSTMPNHCFGLEEGDNTNQKILEDARTCLNNYYLGKSTLDDIKQGFKETFEEIKQHNVNKFRTNGYNIADNTQILLDTYEKFKDLTVQSARGVCLEEGAKIANQYGGSQDQDWVYYDADYYYESEDLKSKLKDWASEVSVDNGLGNVDLSSRAKSRMLNNMDDFNSSWAYDSKNNINRCEMIDSTIEPPKGFTFFYKEKKYSQNDFKNGTRYCISARNPYAGKNETSTVSWYITVPKGDSLLKSNSKINLQSLIRNNHSIPFDHPTTILDVDSLLDNYPQRDYQDKISAFIKDNFNNFDEGVLNITADNWQSTTTVPFDAYTKNGAIDHFNAFELVCNNTDLNSDKINNYIKNFKIYTRAYDYFKS